MSHLPSRSLRSGARNGRRDPPSPDTGLAIAGEVAPVQTPTACGLAVSLHFDDFSMEVVPDRRRVVPAWCDHFDGAGDAVFDANLIERAQQQQDLICDVCERLVDSDGSRSIMAPPAYPAG
jgi:hypothetical protein